MSSLPESLQPVLVLAGGLSHERDVSLRSGRRAAEALRAAGLEVELRDVDASLLPAMMAAAPGAVIPLLHGGPGEDGSLRAVLELLHLPYVGTRPTPSRLAYDKPTANALVAATGVAVPETITLPESTFRDLGADRLLRAVADRLGFPLVVQPARGGSSLGCTVVREPAELPSAMVSCFAYGDDAMLQQFITGTEVAVSLVERVTPEESPDVQALPVVEIVADGGTYDYTARYTAGTTEFFVPARLAEDTLAEAVAAGTTAHRALRLRDLSRIDLLVDGRGVPWFLEANVAPGLTETSTFPQAVEAAGLDLGRLLAGLVAGAVTRAAADDPSSR